jgi:hypothetical protein
MTAKKTGTWAEKKTGAWAEKKTGAWVDEIIAGRRVWAREADGLQVSHPVLSPLWEINRDETHGGLTLPEIRVIYTTFMPELEEQLLRLEKDKGYLAEGSEIWFVPFDKLAIAVVWEKGIEALQGKLDEVLPIQGEEPEAEEPPATIFFLSQDELQDLLKKAAKQGALEAIQALDLEKGGFLVTEERLVAALKKAYVDAKVGLQNLETLLVKTNEVLEADAALREQLRE